MIDMALISDIVTILILTLIFFITNIVINRIILNRKFRKRLEYGENLIIPNNIITTSGPIGEVFIRGTTQEQMQQLRELAYSNRYVSHTSTLTTASDDMPITFLGEDNNEGVRISMYDRLKTLKSFNYPPKKIEFDEYKNGEEYV